MASRWLTTRLTMATLATGMALLTMTACAQETSTLGDPGAPTPPRQVSAVEPAAETGTDLSRYTVHGSVTNIELVETRSLRAWGLSKEAARKLEKPSCAPESVDVAIEDGTGEVIALATLDEPKPVNVEKTGGTALWECNYTYTATVPPGSPVYKFRATSGSLDTGCKSEQYMRSEAEVRDGRTPYLMVSCF